MGNLMTRPRPRRPAPPTFDSIDTAANMDVDQNIPNTGAPEPAVGVPVTEGIVTSAPPPTAPSTERIELTVSGEKLALAYGAPHKLLAMLSLKAPSAVETVSRPAIDLVCCIDKSGSMGGAKMQLMKQTLELLVLRGGLKEGDRISLVTFDARVSLELPLTRMDAAGRAQAETTIKRLHTGSTTNLSGGALKAIDVLDASAASPPEGPTSAKEDVEKVKTSRTRAVMLFTDGHANEGIRETPALVAAVSGALAAASARVGGPIALYTFGFGADHNEDCLRALAEGSGASGIYYFISTPEDIPNAFADCLGGLTSVACQNATLALKACGEGVTVSRVLDSAYKRDADGSLILGDLFAEDQKDILLELQLPKLAAPAGPAPVLTAALRAFNVGRAAPETVEVIMEIARPAVTPTDQPFNAQLDAQRNRIEAANAMEEASRMADAGDVEGGRRMLQACRAAIAASGSADHTLSYNLKSGIDELEAHYRSASGYRSYGAKMSKMHASSMQRQRANHMQSEDLFTAGASKKRALKMSWMASIASSGPQQGYGSDSD